MSRMLRPVITVLVLMLGLTFLHVPAAEALNLQSPPMWLNSDDGVDCLVVNLGTVTYSVRIQFLGLDGTVLDDSGLISLASGKSAFNTYSFSEIDRGVRCKIRIIGAVSKADFRATMQRFNGFSSSLNGVSVD